MDFTEREYRNRHTTAENVLYLRKVRAIREERNSGLLPHNETTGCERVFIIPAELVGLIHFEKDDNYRKTMHQMIEDAMIDECPDEAYKIAAKIAAESVKF